jgi:hypothetical protein
MEYPYDNTALKAPAYNVMQYGFTLCDAAGGLCALQGKLEQVPRSHGKSRRNRAYEVFLALCKTLIVAEKRVACEFHTRWEQVYRSVKALDKVRRQETGHLKRAGYEEGLTHSRYCFMKNEANLTEKQSLKLSELLKYGLKSLRVYLLKESFQGGLAIQLDL